MTVLSVSAVNFSTGALTSTAHGQVTGNGPVRLFAGSGGVIPTGLAPVTDYWLIVVDANTLKLASSSANAMSNTPVSFSSNGTLPLELLIGIPYTRARTSAPGTQVYSDDLNAFQDTFTAIWNLLTGQAQSLFSAVTLAVPLTADLKRTGSMTIGLRNAAGVNFVLGSFPFTWSYTGTSSGSVVIDFNLPDNMSITDISWDYQSSVTGALGAQTCFLQEVDIAGVATTLITAAGNPPSTSMTTYKMSTFVSVTGGTVTGSLPIAIDGQHSYRLELAAGPDASGATFKFGGGIVLSVAYG